MNIYLWLTIIIILLIIIYILTNNSTINTEFFTDVNDVGLFVINMKFRTDKKKRMEDELKKHGLSAEFIDAIVGYNIDIDKMVSNNLINNKINRPMRRGEIGCYLSHIKSWESFLKSNYKYALILEDDAVFLNDFKNKLNDLMEEIDFPFDIIYLNDNCEHHFGDKCLYGVQKSKNLFKPGTVGYGLYGYLLSREGAKKLIDIALPIEMPIDDKTMRMYEDGELIGYKLIEPYIFVASIIDSDTMNIK